MPLAIARPPLAVEPLLSVAEPAVLPQLEQVAAGQGLDSLAARLGDLQSLVADDLHGLEAALVELRAERPETLIHKGATHLLALGGKRLRPLCVLLAARIGPRTCPGVRELAVAVELVHSATLLHDDVIDLSEQRRGAPAARVVYGNAASIFAGDFLLIEAIRRVRRSGIAEALPELLDVIDQMILAEAVQLSGRGRINADRAVYLRVIEGKTAALFRWAMYAGGRAGGLDEAGCRALGDYGLHLGVAFQAIDDLLDLCGDAQVTGKSLFADLREGKMTYPLIIAQERDPGLCRLLLEIVQVSAATDVVPEPLQRAVLESLRRTGALNETRAMACARIEQAIGRVSHLPPGRAQAALCAVAEAAINRDR